MGISIPTSRDIYLEVDGKRLAVVESYKSHTVRESATIEAFGETQPVGTIGGKVRHELTLSRVYITQDAWEDGVNFYDLDAFNLVIVKPDRRVIYTGCRWSDIHETAALGEAVLESVSIVAAGRMEIR